MAEGTIAALDVQAGGFGAEGAGADDDAGDAHEVGDVCSSQAADGGVGDGGVDEELVFGEGFGEVEVGDGARGVEDALGAVFERRFELDSTLATDTPYSWTMVQLYYWYDLGRLVVHALGEVLVEGDEVGDIDVAVVLF